MKNDISDVMAAMKPQPLAQHVFQTKYTFEGETSHGDVHERVATALARDEQQKLRFMRTQADGFVPGGRINSAAGTNRASTMINCFVQPVEDTMIGTVNGMPGIMPALAEASETMRRGGGVGYDFSKLRPQRARVKGTHSEASGPVSYMRVFDRACATVESAGSRRGAQMGVLRVDHPDIELFVDAKKTPDFKSLGLNEAENQQLMRLIRTKQDFGWAVRGAFATLSNFNISVGVTDKFMNAVVEDGDFELIHVAEPAFPAETVTGDDGVQRYVYRRVRARDLWDKIMRNAYETGDPGILFLDTINRVNNLWYCEQIAACNPCGEQNLPPYGCCDLGHSNLTKFVREPFTAQAWFDFDAFKGVVAGGVELLDRVLDVTKWPLPQQAAEAAAKRRIGAGFFGLGDAMAMLGLRYGSPDSAKFAGDVQRAMRDAAYRASIELAKTLGAFPLFDAEKYLKQGTFASTLPQDIQEDIRKFGIRNSHLLSIAPTGTTAMAFGDNASSGIEPIFDLTAYRNVRTGRGEERATWKADDYAYRVLKLVHGEEAKSAALVTAQELQVADHLAVVAAVAPYVDSAISKTINVPREYPFEDFQDVYLQAWKGGLKGLTCYRPSEMVGSVLVSQAEHEASLSEAAQGGAPAMSDVDPLRVSIESRPAGELAAVTEKVVYYTHEGKKSLYLVVSFARVSGVIEGQAVMVERPIEVFVPAGQSDEAQQWVTAAMRLMSLNARDGRLPKALADLRKVVWDKGPVRCGFYEKQDGQKVPCFHNSEVAALAYSVQQILYRRGFLEKDGSVVPAKALAGRSEPAAVTPVVEGRSDAKVRLMAGKQCPECGAHAVIRKDGCDQCTNCEYTGSCG